MNKAIEIQKSNQSVAIDLLKNELMLEQQYQQIGLAFDINLLMIGSGKFQQFTKKYSNFSNKNEETPNFFLNLGEHVRGFIEFGHFEGNKATNAGIWVISRIWHKKWETGSILTPELKAKYGEINTAKKQKTELHKAISKIAKGKKADTFEAGLKVNLANLIDEVGMRQIGAIVNDSESIRQIETIKQIAGDD